MVALAAASDRPAELAPVNSRRLKKAPGEATTSSAGIRTEANVALARATFRVSRRDLGLNVGAIYVDTMAGP